MSPELANKLIDRIDETIRKQAIRTVNAGLAGMNTLPKDLPFIGDCGCRKRAATVEQQAEKFKQWLRQSSGQKDE